MQNLDFKYYLAVFWRRFPYFLVIAVFVSAIGLTIAAILPPVFRATSTLLVETPQIPGDLAESTVPVNAIEQIEIIQQRLTTRANMLDLAKRFNVYADRPDMSAGDIVGDMRNRTIFDVDQPLRQGRPIPGATIIRVSFDALTPGMSSDVTNEITTLILQENVRIRTGQATDTLDFFEQEVERLGGELDRMSRQILAFKNEHQDALPDSLDFRRNGQTLNQERMLQLEREESTLKDQRGRIVSIYEQTGRVVSDRKLSPEEEQLADTQRQLAQARMVYSETSPNVRNLKNRVAALEPAVKDHLALVNPEYAGMSEYEIQLAQIDGRLESIGDEKARIQETLDDLDASIRATPANDIALTALERDRDNLRAQYDSAEKRLAQAAVGERIEVLAKGERFSLVEQATPPQDPIKPSRLLIGGGSVAAGLGAGLGFIVLLELLNRSIRRPVEISAKLGLQPYATIPYIRTRREAGWKRGVIIAVLGLIAIAIPAGLFAIHTYYLPLDLILHNVADKIGLSGFLAQAF